MSPLPPTPESEVLGSASPEGGASSQTTSQYAVQRADSSPARPYTVVQSPNCGPASNDVVDTFIGVNWVLQLESPCLNHVHLVADPTGSHSHMVSSQLINACPPNLNYEAPKTDEWHLDAASLSKLLQLSRTFELDEEITIVQAWYILRQHPQFQHITHEVLSHLYQSISKDVKCYGYLLSPCRHHDYSFLLTLPYRFGAVVDRDLWNEVVTHALGPQGNQP